MTYTDTSFLLHERVSDLDSDSAAPSLHTIHAYVTGLLLALVGIKYQALNCMSWHS